MFRFQPSISGLSSWKVWSIHWKLQSSRDDIQPPFWRIRWFAWKSHARPSWAAWIFDFFFEMEIPKVKQQKSSKRLGVESWNGNDLNIQTKFMTILGSCFFANFQGTKKSCKKRARWLTCFFLTWQWLAVCFWLGGSHLWTWFSLSQGWDMLVHFIQLIIKLRHGNQWGPVGHLVG